MCWEQETTEMCVIVALFANMVITTIVIKNIYVITLEIKCSCLMFQTIE